MEKPAHHQQPQGAAHRSEADAFRYIRDKVNQLLTVMGTLPLNPDELDDDTLIALDPIGIIADSFSQILAHLHETNESLTLHRNEIQSILDAVGTAIVVVNEKLELLSFNQQSRETLFNGIIPFVGTPLCDLLGGNGCVYRDMFEHLLRAESTVEHTDIEVQGRHYQVVATPARDEQGRLARAIFSFSDISSRKQAEDQLRQAAAVFDNTTEGILITDERKRIVSVNHAFCQMTGYKESEVLGKSPSILQSGRQDAGFYKKMWASLQQKGYWRGEIWDRHKTGNAFPVLQSIKQVKRADGSVSNYVSILTDISAIKKSQETLDFLAYHDPLTKLPNRILFNERLDHALKLAKRDRSKLAVIFMDLDRFKNVNDSLGHDVGDQLLVETSKRIAAQFRASDTIARLGGDEFVILLEEISDPQFVAVMCRSLIAAFQTPFSIDMHNLSITPSLGISLFPDDGQDLATLIKHADAAMYRAKEMGRNEFQFFTQELSSRAYERLMLESALRAALKNDQLELYFQPLLSMESGQVVAAEALLRWRHPELGLVSPDKFIPLAEETGLILPIGEWALQQACQHARRWVERFPAFASMAVNLSGRQFQSGKLVESVKHALEASQLEAVHLELEITESFLMEKAEQTVKTLDELKALGLSLSIDDFGTGYSSLSYLKRFPVDKLKIDRSFIRDVTIDPEDAAIAKAVIALGRSMQLRIVAEGVETEAQQAFMQEQACDLVQGYLYSQPLPADQFENYLEQHQPEKHFG